MALYDAFISYSHAKDKPIAAALQSVVQRLGKPWYRRRALRVFRDDTSLSATPHMWPTIEQALAQSRFLILIASPEAAASPWVGKEVAHWLAHKSADTIFVAVTDGVLAWDHGNGDWRDGAPLPPVLAGRFRSEPKWVDLRAYRGGADKGDAKFTEHAADFAAAIHGMPKEDLLSQEVRQQRRALTLAWSAAGSLLVLVGVAGWQWKTAVDAERLAVRNFGIAKNAADHVVFSIAQDLRDVQGMRVESVRRILDVAQSMMDELARAAPDDLRLQRSRGVMLTEFAETYLGAGDLVSARTAAEESVAIMRQLIAADPGNAQWQRDTYVSVTKVGNIRLAAGDRTGALAAYEEGLGIVRKLAAADPGHAGRQADLSVSLVKIGDVRLEAGDRTGALAAYQESLAIMRKLAATEPGNTKWQRGVYVSLVNVGDVRVEAGDRAAALAAYEESLAIARRLAAADPGNAGWQGDVYVSLIKVGDEWLRAGNRTGALAAYDESLTIMRKLTASDPGNARWRHGVSVSLTKVGDVRLAAGDLAGALVVYEESLGVMRKLVAADPNNAGWQLDLSARLVNVGDVRLAAGDRVGALAAYEESLGVRRKLAAADPGNAGWQAGLIIGLYKLSTVSDPPRARAALQEALAIAEKLAREGKLTAAQQNWPQHLRDELAKLPPEQAEAR